MDVAIISITCSAGQNPHGGRFIKFGVRGAYICHVFVFCCILAF